MKIRKDRQTSTIMYIPPAHRPIRRLRFYRTVMAGIVCVMTLAVITFQIMQFRTQYEATQQISLLEQRIDIERSQHREHIASKDDTIESLQMDVYELTQAAENIKRQLDELKRLEREIRTLSHEAELILDDLGAAPSTPQALGGEQHPLSETIVMEWMDETRDMYIGLEHEMHHLTGLLEHAKQSLQDIEEAHRHTPSIWPTDERSLSSGYGIRKDPFTQKLTMHAGVDIAGKSSSAIYATAAGEVVETGNDAVRGRYIIIDHSYDLKTIYMHLSQISVSKGDVVQKGEQIGKMGSTGRSTGVHLHYEVLKNDQAVNPRLYMND